MGLGIGFISIVDQPCISEEQIQSCQDLLKKRFENIELFNSYGSFLKRLPLDAKLAMVIFAHKGEEEGQERALLKVIKCFETTPVLMIKDQYSEELLHYIEAMPHVRKVHSDHFGEGLVPEIIDLAIHTSQINESLIQLEKECSKMFRLATYGRTLAEIVHEVKNPLAIMKGTLDQIKAKEGTPLDEKSTERLERGIERIRNLLSTISGYWEQDRLTSFEMVPINKILDEVEEYSTLRVKAAGADFRVNNLENDREIFCIKDSLLQVFLNLIFNACDAIEDCDERWIEIKVYHSEDEVIFDFIDSGQISDMVKAHLMDPDFMTKQKSGGTGLGLSLCRSFLKAQGGRLTLVPNTESTCFRVIMSGGEKESDEVLNRSNKTQPTVLVVDDEPDMRAFIMEEIGSLGYKVIGANSGEAALALLHKENVQLMVTDIRMPYKNGLELCDTVRNLEKAPAIIVLSAYPYDLEKRPDLKKDIRWVINKPFHVGQFLRAVKEAITAPS